MHIIFSRITKKLPRTYRLTNDAMYLLDSKRNVHAAHQLNAIKKIVITEPK